MAMVAAPREKRTKGAAKPRKATMEVPATGRKGREPEPGTARMMPVR